MDHKNSSKFSVNFFVLNTHKIELQKQLLNLQNTIK